MSWSAAEDGERLETPERVDLSVDLAGVGSRSLACLFDTLLIVLTLVASSLALYVSSIFVGRWLIAAIFIESFLLNWFYFAGFEALGDGQTPGKRLVGLRVQKIGGYPIGWSEALIRNFLRVVDSLLGYSVGIVVMLLTPRSQRLGDLAAGTVVVRERSWARAELERIGYEGSAFSQGNAGAGLDLSGSEFEMLHEFLARRDTLTPEARHRIAASMASLLKQRLSERGGLPDSWSTLGGEAFLQALDAAFRGDAGDLLLDSPQG